MTYTAKNASGSTIYIDADGAGSSGDPHIPRVKSKNVSEELFNSGGSGGAQDGDIRDTAIHDNNLSTDITQGKNRTFFIKNDLDQSVTVSIWLQDSAIGAFAMVFSLSVAAGAHLIIGPAAGGTGTTPTYESLPLLANAKLGPNGKFRIQAGTSPSSGTLKAGVGYEL